MATATAPIVENPNNSTDLNLTPPSTGDVSPTQQPPPSDAGGDELNSKTAEAESAAKTSDVDGGGAGTDVQKKMKRAERFGMPVHLSEEEKRSTRAERFGTASATNGLDSSKQSEELKRKARADRFGVVQSTPTDEEVKKKARLARFGSSPPIDPAEEDKKKTTEEDKNKKATEEDIKKAAEEEKKKARALRFSQPDASSKANGEKAAGASKAGGGT